MCRAVGSVILTNGSGCVVFIVIRATIVNGTYGIHENLYIYITIFTNNVLVLLTMVPRNSKNKCIHLKRVKEKRVIDRLASRVAVRFHVRSRQAWLCPWGWSVRGYPTYEEARGRS